MDKNNSTARYDQWRHLIEAHKKSGLSQIEFCKQQGISSTHLSYYRTRIKSREGKSQTTLFAPIQLQKSSGTHEQIQILLPNGLRCFLPAMMDAMRVKRLMGVLLTC